MSTGIAQESCIIEYVAAVSELIAGWASKNEYQRPGVLFQAAAAQLNKFHVPWPGPRFEDMERADGQFAFRTWDVKVSRKKWKWNAPKAGKDQTAFKKGVAKLADTVYHEHRHCEQWFRMARFLAAEYDPAAIRDKMGIPIEVAQKAKELPALTGEDLDEGQAWYKAVYVRPAAPKVSVATPTAVGGVNQRALVYAGTKLRPTVRQPAVGKSEKANVKEDELDAISSNRQRTSYLQYRNLLLEEADAHAVGTAVQEQIYSVEGLEGKPQTPEHIGVRPNVTNY